MSDQMPAELRVSVRCDYCGTEHDLVLQVSKTSIEITPLRASCVVYPSFND